MTRERHAIAPPIDPKHTRAWGELENDYRHLHADLQAWFNSDPKRAERLSFEAGDLFVDLSKNLVTDEILHHLVELAGATHVHAHTEAMFKG